jgi:hypothetical protein
MHELKDFNILENLFLNPKYKESVLAHAQGCYEKLSDSYLHSDSRNTEERFVDI